MWKDLEEYAIWNYSYSREKVLQPIIELMSENPDFTEVCEDQIRTVKEKTEKKSLF
jgi:hypothetical protein